MRTEKEEIETICQVCKKQVIGILRRRYDDSGDLVGATIDLFDDDKVHSCETKK